MTPHRTTPQLNNRSTRPLNVCGFPRRIAVMILAYMAPSSARGLLITYPWVVTWFCQPYRVSVTDRHTAYIIPGPAVLLRFA